MADLHLYKDMRYLHSTLLFFLLLGFSSCKKEDKDKITGDDEVTTGEFSMLLAAVLDAVKLSEDAMDSNYGASFVRIGTDLSCAAITIDSNATQKTYTLNFSSACSSYDGYNRVGKIIVQVSGTAGKYYNMTDALTTITFEGYQYRTSQLTGTINLKCLTSDKFEFTYDASLSFNQGSGPSVSCTADLIRTTDVGAGDAYLLNNEYIYSSKGDDIEFGSGKNSLDQEFSVTFSDNFRQKISCHESGNGRYPVSGELTFSRPSAKRDIDLYFGDGSCDNAVTLERNSTKKTIFY